MLRRAPLAASLVAWTRRRMVRPNECAALEVTVGANRTRISLRQIK